MTSNAPHILGYLILIKSNQLQVYTTRGLSILYYIVEIVERSSFNIHMFTFTFLFDAYMCENIVYPFISIQPLKL